MHPLSFSHPTPPSFLSSHSLYFTPPAQVPLSFILIAHFSTWVFHSCFFLSPFIHLISLSPLSHSHTLLPPPPTPSFSLSCFISLSKFTHTYTQIYTHLHTKTRSNYYQIRVYFPHFPFVGNFIFSFCWVPYISFYTHKCQLITDCNTESCQEMHLHIVNINY